MGGGEGPRAEAGVHSVIVYCSPPTSRSVCSISTIVIWENMSKIRFGGRSIVLKGDVLTEMLMKYASGKIKYSLSYKSPSIRKNVSTVDRRMKVDSIKMVFKVTGMDELIQQENIRQRPRTEIHTECYQLHTKGSAKTFGEKPVQHSVIHVGKGLLKKRVVNYIERCFKIQ